MSNQSVNAQDLFAAIGMVARRISAAVAQTEAGSPTIPAAASIREAIDRMSTLCDHMETIQQASVNAGKMLSSVHLTADLDVIPGGIH
jgi:hypothetical protein